jgi:hypothetical protein
MLEVTAAAFGVRGRRPEAVLAIPRRTPVPRPRRIRPPTSDIRFVTSNLQPPTSVSRFHPINLPAAVLHEIVIVRHRPADGLVRHELFLDREEVFDPIDLRFRDERPERLSRDVREQTQRFMPMSCSAVEMLRILSIRGRTLPGLQCSTSRMTYITRSLSARRRTGRPEGLRYIPPSRLRRYGGQASLAPPPKRGPRHLRHPTSNLYPTIRATFSLDMKSAMGIAPVIAERNAFVAS